MHVRNLAARYQSRRMQVRNVRQLSNPGIKREHWEEKG